MAPLTATESYQIAVVQAGPTWLCTLINFRPGPEVKVYHGAAELFSDEPALRRQYDLDRSRGHFRCNKPDEGLWNRFLVFPI